VDKIRLGRTNLRVTRLGWGSIPLQRVEEGTALSVVREVVEMGVDLLDTARGYTTSERRMGLALKGISRPVVLSSKSPVRTDKIYDEVQVSLKNLQVKKIDIYHLHNVSKMEDYEKVMAPGGGYAGLARAQEEGLIDYIGFTSHNLDVLERALGDDRFAVIMVCYSFLEPDAARRIFPLARAKDVGVLVMKPFSGGVIERAGPALKYVLAEPDIVPIPGSESVEKARENWAIFSGGAPLAAEERAYIETLQKQLQHQFCRRCDYCQPCSQEINIQMMMGLKSVVKRFGAGADAPGWIRGVVEKARSCTECGECLPRCPYQLPIPELVRKHLDFYDGLAK
jgi:uncharacterized protein